LPQFGLQGREPFGHDRWRHIEGERGSAQAAAVANRQNKFKVAAFHSCLKGNN
jgi:hypothetical protein